MGARIRYGYCISSRSTAPTPTVDVYIREPIKRSWYCGCCYGIVATIDIVTIAVVLILKYTSELLPVLCWDWEVQMTS